MRFESIEKIKALLQQGCKIQKVYPAIFASDAEVNIVTIELKCHDGKIHKIRAYREEAQILREFIRVKKNQ